jgi:hypothetical protein
VILAKAEFLNPGGTSKDRIGQSSIACTSYTLEAAGTVLIFIGTPYILKALGCGSDVPFWGAFGGSAADDRGGGGVGFAPGGRHRRGGVRAPAAPALRTSGTRPQFIVIWG